MAGGGGPTGPTAASLVVCITCSYVLEVERTTKFSAPSPPPPPPTTTSMKDSYRGFEGKRISFSQTILGIYYNLQPFLDEVHNRN